MGNCYAACGADWEDTVGMVSSSRHRTPDDVIATLRQMAAKYGSEKDYQALRSRVPAAFPF